MFKLDTNVTVANVNPRTENHGDEDVLAIDIKLKAVFPAAQIIQLFCAGVDTEDFIDVFWLDSGRPRFESDHSLKLETKLEGFKVELFETFLDERKEQLFCSLQATIGKFACVFNEGSTFKTTFVIQTEVSEKEAGVLCGLLKQNVYVLAEEQQQEMDLDDVA